MYHFQKLIVNSFKKFPHLLLTILFLLISVLTIYDYGMNWDSPVHYARGQAFLHYLLTGNKNYAGEPKFCQNSYEINSKVDYKTGETCNRHRKIRVSEYRSDALDYSWSVKDVFGHPAFSNIMLAISNKIFFEKLGLVEDIPAYNLYSVIVTFLLALTIAIWVKETFGFFASAISIITFYTFPLLFAEQHFNIKDPPMASFFIISLYFFWQAFKSNKLIFLFISALFGGFSLGTKFNYLFAPILLSPWLLIYLINRIREQKSKFINISPKLLLLNLFGLLPKNFLPVLIIYPLITVLVFVITWPALWNNTLHNISEVFRYYNDIGNPRCTYFPFSLKWILKCSDLITLKTFLYTTPIFSMFLFAVGLVIGIFKSTDKKTFYVTSLWISIVILTILRVTLPITGIYGGLRQIMEFIPAFAMLAGVGAWFIKQKFVRSNILSKLSSKKNLRAIFISLILFLGFIPTALELVALHPNQNIYFNSLIGGLEGAASGKFPGYANTYGNVYIQGVKWINQYADANPVVALLNGSAQNISRASLREDTTYGNHILSSYFQKGEYIIYLTKDGGDPYLTRFQYKYVEKFLNPVYDYNVRGVSLLKIWHNSSKNVKSNINIKDDVKEKPHISYHTVEGKSFISISLTSTKNLKRLSFKFPDKTCKKPMIGAKISISEDNINFTNTKEEINDFTEEETNDYKSDFTYLFTGENAKHINIAPPDNYKCNIKDILLDVYTFKNLFTDIK